MRQVATALIAIACLTFAAHETASAQGQGASVAFRNQTNNNVLVKGYTIVPGGKRNGQILPIPKNGGKAYDANVLPGVRFITVYDALQPAKILLQDFPVPIQNRDVSFDIVPVPGNANRVMLVPTPAPKE